MAKSKKKGGFGAPAVKRACGARKKGPSGWKVKGFPNYAACAHAVSAGKKGAAAKKSSKCPPGFVKEPWGCVENPHTAVARARAATLREEGQELIGSRAMDGFGRRRRRR
jgi:hypothetical protein